jgi:predicted GNAT family N-acyltransferase
VELIDLGALSEEQYAELVGDEKDPWDAGHSNLEWRPKDRHVAVRGADGRLVAAAGLLVATARFGAHQRIDVVGIGGVIVAAPHRGRGLGDRVISAALDRAHGLGPRIAMLFCLPDRADLYRRYGFADVPGPVLVEQPKGAIEIPMVTMWRPLKQGATLPAGRVMLDGLPF